MEYAETFEEWVVYAKSLDYLEGKDKWKRVNHSRYYDYQRIEARYKNLKLLRKHRDLQGLVFCLRQDLVKNLGGIATPQLYEQCHFGTKRVIEKYHNEVIKCIQFIYYYKGSKFDLSQKIEFFAETRHSYGRTALLLSGKRNFVKANRRRRFRPVPHRSHQGLARPGLDAQNHLRLFCRKHHRCRRLLQKI